MYEVGVWFVSHRGSSFIFLQKWANGVSGSISTGEGTRFWTGRRVASEGLFTEAEDTSDEVDDDGEDGGVDDDDDDDDNDNENEDDNDNEDDDNEDGSEDNNEDRDENGAFDDNHSEASHTKSKSSNVVDVD